MTVSPRSEDDKIKRSMQSLNVQGKCQGPFLHIGHWGIKKPKRFREDRQPISCSLQRTSTETIRDA
jgi:hypothetical protein